jgi:hypothetical protein
MYAIGNLFIVLLSRSYITKIKITYKKKTYSSNIYLNETDKVTLSARIGVLTFDGAEFSMGSSMCSGKSGIHNTW